MNAKEMFEELGYEELGDKYYGYIDAEGYIFNIQFDKLTKLIMLSTIDRDITISLDELKAINEQIEELGWIE